MIKFKTKGVALRGCKENLDEESFYYLDDFHWIWEELQVLNFLATVAICE